MATDDGLDWSVFDGARIKFWVCSENHRNVRWDGDAATCLDCGRTNQGGTDEGKSDGNR